MKASIIEKFIENITQGKREHFERFYKIFSARGFLLELDRNSGKVRLSDDSHREDGEFLEMLQNIHYKKVYHKPHQDTINEQENEDIARDSHRYFNHIDTKLFDIHNNQYLTEIFTHEIPVDLFRLNWERDRYGKFDQFRKCEYLPKIRVYDLEPFIARLVISVSSIGISTWSSCEGHWGEPAYLVFDRKYNRIWFQAIVNKFIKKKLNLVCSWEWLGWDERCSISSPCKDFFELYLEIQNVARLIYDNRIILRNIKKQVCSHLTDKHKSMNQKELLNIFESYFEGSIKSL
ncbi:MAG: hypothetical protein L3J17_08040 [Candidatus Jettenia sp.]|nr:MAG: hypothetical protein L3J17_08040 [Candidatus Jettenia sp.]